MYYVYFLPTYYTCLYLLVFRVTCPAHFIAFRGRKNAKSPTRMSRKYLVGFKFRIYIVSLIFFGPCKYLSAQVFSAARAAISRYLNYKYAPSFVISPQPKYNRARLCTYVFKLDFYKFLEPFYLLLLFNLTISRLQ